MHIGIIEIHAQPVLDGCCICHESIGICQISACIRDYGICRHVILSVPLDCYPGAGTDFEAGIGSVIDGHICITVNLRCTQQHIPASIARTMHIDLVGCAITRCKQIDLAVHGLQRDLAPLAGTCIRGMGIQQCAVVYSHIIVGRQCNISAIFARCIHLASDINIAFVRCQLERMRIGSCSACNGVGFDNQITRPDPHIAQFVEASACQEIIQPCQCICIISTGQDVRIQYEGAAFAGSRIPGSAALQSTRHIHRTLGRTQCYQTCIAPACVCRNIYLRSACNRDTTVGRIYSYRARIGIGNLCAYHF